MVPESSGISKPRPVNLNLFAFRFPLTAIVSILHRISGVVLFLCIPFMVWALSLSLQSPEGFAGVQTFLLSPLMRVVLWLFLSGLSYHLFAGIRHLLMESFLDESLSVGHNSALVVILLSIGAAVGIGVWLW